MSPVGAATRLGRAREIVRSGALREFSPRERLADRTIHIVGLVTGVTGAAALTLAASIAMNWAALATVIAYSSGLVAMLSFSAAYNLGHRSRYRHVLRRLDHAAIFVMIAGTYTPFTILGLDGPWRVGMTIAVWAVAAAGVAVKLLAPASRSTRISTVLYLAFGWMGLVAIDPLLRGLSPAVLILIAVGGALYSIGVVFHALHRLPYQNAIWHAFVLAAAMVHFAAVSGMVAAAG
jgi:hemolysin III